METLVKQEKLKKKYRAIRRNKKNIKKRNNRIG